MAFQAGRVEVHLGARLERRDFELYERELKKIREQVSKKEAFRANLGADFSPRAFNAYQRELKRTEGITNDNVRASGKLHTAFGNIYGRGGVLFAAAGGLAGLGIALKSVTKAYGEAEVSQRKMAAQLKASGISFDAHAKQIDKVIQATSKLSGLDDEDLQDAFTAIVRTTKSVNTGLKDMALVADLARAKHIDVATAGQLVARVHAGNVRALKSLGIEFVASTKHADELRASTKKYTPEQLAAAKAADKHSDSTRALGLLQNRLKGQAEAYGRTQQGAMDRVNVAFENLRESIGRGLAPTVTRASNTLARFINQMQDGTGTGGAFVRTLQAVAHNFKVFGDRCRADIDLLLSFVTTVIDGEGAIARLAGKLIPGKDRFDKFADAADRASDRINALRKQIRPSGHEFDNLTTVVGNMNDHLGDGRGFKRLSTNLRSIRTLAHTNVTGAVSDVQKGMNDIRAALSQGLKDMGVSGTLKPTGGGGLGGGLATPLHKAGGGWIGQRGMRGQDVVPAMLAPGEAVLNRHQQSIIETLLGDGFLDQLFARVNTPHYFARGGLAPAVSSLSNKLDSMFGLVTTSTTGGTHAPGSYHYQGLAADVAGPASSMYRASEWIKSSGTYRSLLEGIHNPNLAVKNGQLFGGAGPFGGVWANHANHIHVALRSLGAAAAGGGIAGIQIPKLVGGSGALGAIAQAALQKGGKAANSALEKLVGSLGGGDISSAGTKGGYGKSQLAALWRRAGGDPARANLMAAIALAESGGNPRAHNPSGASGLWQILGLPFPGDPFNPSTNARMAVSKYDSQGLGAWEAYTNGSYRQYLAKGGRTGRPPKLAGRVDRAREMFSNVWDAVGSAAGGGPEPRVAFINSPWVGADQDPKSKTYRTVYWPDWMTNMLSGEVSGKRSRGAFSAGFATILHELAHTRQRKGLAEWEAEGGAVNFSRRYAPRAARALGISYANPSLGGDPYTPFYRRVLKEHGGQFFGFARGGRVSKRKSPAKPSASDRSRDYIRPLRALQTDRIGSYDSIIGAVDDYNTQYSVRDREYNLTDEELIRDDGTVDESAVNRRATELAGLASIRARIVENIRAAVKIARRVVRTYQTILKRLKRSLGHASKKDRAGVRSLISTYQGRLTEWQGTLKDLTQDKLPNASLDYRELLKERREVLGTQATDQGGDTGGDLGGSDASGDTGGDTGGDTTTAPPSAIDIAAAAIQDFATFQSGRADLLGTYARNFVSSFGASSPGGVFSGSPSEIAAAGGTRFLGAGSTGGGLGGATIINNYQQLPDNTQTWSSQMRFQVEAMA